MARLSLRVHSATREISYTLFERGGRPRRPQGAVGGTVGRPPARASIGTRGVPGARLEPLEPRLLLSVTPILGDLNGDGSFDAFDVAPFELALTGAAAFEAAYPDVDPLAVGDFDRNGVLNAFDVDNFETALAGTADGIFQAGEPLAANAPESVAQADFNGDGIIDLVNVGFGSPLEIRLGNGDGTFQMRTPLNVGRDASDVQVTDFNLDGIMDLVVALQGELDPGPAPPTDGHVRVLLGVGDGTFVELPSLNNADSHPIALTVGDFDGNGETDIAVVHTSLYTTDQTKKLVTFMGIGDAVFQRRQVIDIGGPASDVTIGDFNGDGAPDLAFAAGHIGILLGIGDGLFGAPQLIDAEASALTVGDFNGDGQLDIATANSGADDVSILLGTGNGQFLPESRYVVGTRPTSIVAADFNGDGLLDLASSNRNTDDVSVLIGRGDGAFLPERRFAAGDGPLSLTTGDFNRDGRPDLVVANRSSDDLSILLNQLPPIAQADATLAQADAQTANQPRAVASALAAALASVGQTDRRVRSSVRPPVVDLLNIDIQPPARPAWMGWL